MCEVCRICLRDRFPDRMSEERFKMKLRDRPEPKGTRSIPALRKVQPHIPASELELGVLRGHLDRMGCAGLLDCPWGIREESLIRDLVEDEDSAGGDTLRGRPEAWDPATWAHVFGFRKGRVTVAERVEEFLEGEFKYAADPKDGYSVRDLRDPDARLIIGFLNPIFHPDKPKRVVSLWASTFLGAMRGKITIDWASLMTDLVRTLVKTARNPKSKAGTPLAPYLAHLYAKHELLRPEEQTLYEELLGIQEYGGMESDSGKESEASDLPPPPAATAPKPSKRAKTTPKPAEEKPARKTKVPDKSGSGELPGPENHPAPITTGGRGGRVLHLSGDPTEEVMLLCNEIRRRTVELYDQEKKFTTLYFQIAEVLGLKEGEDLVDGVMTLARYRTRTVNLEAEVIANQKECGRLRKNLRKAEEEAAGVRTQVEANRRALLEIREALTIPVDVVNKAKLYEEQLEAGEPLTRANVIRFLLDQGRKMEKTVGQLRGLIDSLNGNEPVQQGTQTPGSGSRRPEPTSPERKGKEVVPEASTDSSDGPPTTPAANLPENLDWGSIDLPSTGALLRPLPVEHLQLTPPVFRLPDETPAKEKRASTGGAAPTSGLARDSPGESYQDLVRKQLEAVRLATHAPGPIPLSPVESPAKGKSSGRKHAREDPRSGSESGGPASKRSSRSRGSTKS